MHFLKSKVLYFMLWSSVLLCFLCVIHRTCAGWSLSVCYVEIEVCREAALPWQLHFPSAISQFQFEQWIMLLSCSQMSSSIMFAALLVLKAECMCFSTNVTEALVILRIIRNKKMYPHIMACHLNESLESHKDWGCVCLPFKSRLD